MSAPGPLLFSGIDRHDGLLRVRFRGCVSGVEACVSLRFCGRDRLVDLVVDWGFAWELRCGTTGDETLDTALVHTAKEELARARSASVVVEFDGTWPA
jgi:hypothetical protein